MSMKRIRCTGRPCGTVTRRSAVQSGPITREGWNNGVAGLVEHQHPSVFHLVSVLQQDAALAETLIIQDARGQAPAKRQRRAVQLHQRRLQQLCFDVRHGRKTVPETLNALGHCVRLF